MRRLTAGVILAVMALAGCSADPEQPKLLTISTMKSRLLHRIDAMIGQTETSPNIALSQVQQLSSDLTVFMGHLRTTGVATEDQLYQIAEAQYALSQGKGTRPLPPKDWRPDEDPTPPEIRVPAGSLKGILPKLRDLIAEIPDSDLQAITD